MYLILMSAVILLFFVLPGALKPEGLVSASAYRELLDGGRITKATILQNEEVPTGTVSYTLKDGTSGRVYVSDVTEAQKELEKYEIE